jgi:hypothetical protein
MREARFSEMLLFAQDYNHCFVKIVSCVHIVPTSFILIEF